MSALDIPIPAPAPPSRAAIALGERLVKNLERNPNSGEAFDALGVFALENASAAEAIELFAKAIQLDGPEPRFCAHLAEAFARQGDYAQASACLEQALAGEPNNADLRLALANLRHILGDHDGAAENYERATRIDPARADSWFNLGVTRTIQQRPDQAKQAYREALAIKPMYAEAWNNLAVLERCDGDFAAAEACYRRALLVQPDYADSLYNFAVLLQEQERLQEAIVIYERLTAMQPGFADAHNNLGNSYLKMNNLADARRSFHAARAASAAHREAPWNLGVASLLAGDYAEGWTGYEHRLAQHEQHESRKRFVQVPRWNGRLVPGDRILVHHEQGLGDTIQFARFLRVLAQKGLKVDVLCQSALRPLLSRVPGIAQCASDADSVRGSQWQIPFPSLPYALGTRADSLPADIPYLSVDPQRLAAWKELFSKLPEATHRVGLVWQGNPQHRNDRNRSLDPALLDRLLEIPGIQFLSLQKGADRAKLPARVQDLSPLLVDFMETAAAIQCLNLVISVDTSVAHLAGALGKPVWTLLPFAPDWRWMLHREDSPWYPTMRLFRQATIGDWPSVIGQVRRRLEEWKDSVPSRLPV